MNRVAGFSRICRAFPVLAMLSHSTAFAQTDVEELGRRFGATPPPQYYEILQSDPNAFQFSQDNGWIRRGRRVAAIRSRIRSGRAEGAFFTQAASDVGGVMTGDVHMPVFLILFSDTDSAEVASAVPRDSLETRLYGTDPAPPYSIHTYYREVSNDNLNVYGTVFDWVRVPDAASTYEGTDNGLNCTRMGYLMRDAAAVLDNTVDFSQFDNDGPDGVPDSGDDDGYVDATVMMHPKVDGSCKIVNSAAWTSIWAHRCSAGPYPTDDVSAATGETIKLRDYIVQGGQGGDEGCTSNEPQAMGVVAHETGHLFGLPDLYEVGGDGAGIGQWGLMGSGGQHKPDRPTHLSAWSKAQLGWVTEVSIDRDTTLEISPVVTSDTTYVLPIPDTHEYFLLENRQRIGSDSMIHEEGLLIWHVDSYLASTRGNNVNTPTYPYAVALEQADGREDLWNGDNRGDRGDPFPGSTANHSFGRNTTPSSRTNDGEYSFVELDWITTAEGSGMIQVKVDFAPPPYIAASDTNAVVEVDGVEYNVFNEYLTPGMNHTIDMQSPQEADAGRRRFVWVSWSNGEPRRHSLPGSLMGDTIIANVAAEYQLFVNQLGTGNGKITTSAPMDIANGAFLSADSVVTLVASVDSAGHIFEGWFGPDTTASTDTLTLRMSRPFALEAVFAAPLIVADEALPAATMGAEFSYRLAASGGVADKSWGLVSGTLPHGLTLTSGGFLAGLPEETGSFTLGVEVASGSQTALAAIELDVSAPSLTASDVLQHLVGEGSPLSDEDIVYLDLVGNENSELDLGDFLGWVEATGGSVTTREVAAAIEALQNGDSGTAVPPRNKGEGRSP